MHIPTNFKPLLAHIIDEAGNIFQVVNAAGDDWDEAATAAQQAAFNQQQQGQPT